MDSLSIKCPNCGATIQEKPQGEFVGCSFCNSVFRVTTEEELISAQGLEVIGNVLTKYTGKSANPIIPLGVEKIAEGAFRNSGIAGIMLPITLKEIGAYAFADCKNLCEITIPQDVKYIGNRAFWRCTNLSKIDFDGDDTELGDGVILGTAIYRSFLQNYEEKMKQQTEEKIKERRKSYGLCPYCGSNYSIFGKCKGCGRKR